MHKELTFKTWILLCLLIYAILIGAFLASELFKDVDLIQYPSTFFLIGFALIGPGVMIGTLPQSFALEHPSAAIILRVSAYPFCLLSLRLIYMILHQMQLI